MRGLERLLPRGDALPCAFAVHTTTSGTVTIGTGHPVFDIYVRTSAGQNALQSLDELAISEAYIRGDLDFEGDLITAMSARRVLSDNNVWIKTWKWVRPLLVGRKRCNPGWIAKHYDAGNIQLVAAESRYNTYTPGIYDGEDDTLEAGAERKLSAAFQSLGLKSGDSLLDVGCGWGGFLRYCARRGIHTTGITLSKDQLAYAKARIDEERLTATALYEDFFSFRPEAPFDGVAMMGVMEDLSDYGRVLRQLSLLTRRGGRVYLDFAASLSPVSSFITKHIWPGTFRMVHMPELVDCLSHSPFEFLELHNDRWNYYLWARGVYQRWMERKAEVLARADEARWREFQLLYAGCAELMSSPARQATAYRIVLERVL
jgi:cyclopropane-fatty-acyl-phospholipid synthase